MPHRKSPSPPPLPPSQPPPLPLGTTTQDILSRLAELNDRAHRMMEQLRLAKRQAREYKDREQRNLENSLLCPYSDHFCGLGFCPHAEAASTTSGGLPVTHRCSRLAGHKGQHTLVGVEWLLQEELQILRKFCKERFHHE